jgi:hypothetical protein
MRTRKHRVNNHQSQHSSYADFIVTVHVQRHHQAKNTKRMESCKILYLIYSICVFVEISAYISLT